MNKAIIVMSNGEKITVTENEYLFPVVRTEVKDTISTSMGKPYELWFHIHNGLIPCITEALVNCDFFSLNSDNNKVYSASAVVSIENI